MPKLAAPRVLVTRPALQNQGLVEALGNQGFEPIILPLLKITPFEPFSKISYPDLIEITQRLADFEKVIFVCLEPLDSTFSLTLYFS